MVLLKGRAHVKYYRRTKYGRTAAITYSLARNLRGGLTYVRLHTPIKHPADPVRFPVCADPCESEPSAWRKKRVRAPRRNLYASRLYLTASCTFNAHARFGFNSIARTTARPRTKRKERFMLAHDAHSSNIKGL